MTDRYYDRILACGCMLSSDGGGGIIPCGAEWGDDEEAIALCEESWSDFWKSDDAIIYEKECQEKNQ